MARPQHSKACPPRSRPVGPHPMSGRPGRTPPWTLDRHRCKTSPPASPDCGMREPIRRPGFGFSMAENNEAAVEPGIALEEGLDWEGALQRYESLVRGLESEPTRDAAWEARRASAELRRGNALMVLRRMDDARMAFDAGLHAAKASRDPLVLARALTGAGVFAGSSGDTPRAERFLLESLDRFP